MDDVLIWDHALSETEVSAIYTNGLNGISIGSIPEPVTFLMIALGLLAVIVKYKI